MAQKSKSRPRSYARNREVSRRGSEKTFESDGSYLLKLVVFIVLGTFWIKFANPLLWMGFQFQAIPVGMLTALLLVRIFEKHQSDRKIWYAVIIIVAVASLYLPSGIVV